NGDVASPIHRPTGCHFHPRCPYAFDRCKRDTPALRPVTNGHWSACHLNEGGAGSQPAFSGMTAATDAAP
ncbi:MAG: oligopeptide/dipeptide ABC transporter ATP-binding protein, partial [Pseudorhodoplanes sp.]